MKSYSFLIDYQCPRCGAPATLTETDRLFACEFCRAKSYLLDIDGFRYRFQPAGAPDEHLVYYPYWRFKGMLFTCTAEGVRQRFVDMSLQAAPSRRFPVSLGLRSQALKLRYVTPDDPGRFIPPQLSQPDMRARIEERFRQEIREPVFHQAEIGETASLIYAPYRVKDRIVDAILDEPISPPLPAEERVTLTGGRPVAGVAFLPTLCPGCGWDLEGARDAHLLICRNCRSVWTPSREGFQRMNTACLDNGGGDAAYLPFWRIQADVEGLPLTSYADLVRGANLPRVVQPDWETKPFRFWSPAFKVRPAAFIQLVRAVTLGQPDGTLIPELPGRAPVAVNLPYREALETLKVNIAGWLMPRRRMAERLRDIRIRPKKLLLVYLPFSERSHEYVFDFLNLAVRKSHLATAGNL